VTQPFSDEEVRRFSRQILLREVGGRGQRRLASTPVDLFCPDLVGEVAARYLLRAGVAGLRIYAPADRLQRLAAELSGDGPVAPVPQPPESAPPSLRSLVAAAPGLTLVLLQEQGETEPIWAACRGEQGTLGRGEPDPLAVGEAGDAALLTGSALALLVAQRLLGLPVPQRVELDPTRPDVLRTVS
jgi:hypothetical protein